MNISEIQANEVYMLNDTKVIVCAKSECPDKVLVQEYFEPAKGRRWCNASELKQA